VRSARILKEDQPILDAPGAQARRRGSADRNVDLPVFAARRGEGCAARWLQVGAAAWVCEDAAPLSFAGPIDPKARTWREMPDGLPFRYYFVGPDGSFGYRRIESADVAEPDTQLEPGFAVAIVEERLEGGTRYGRTHRGIWVPMRDLGPIHGFAFSGAELPPDTTEIPFAWVVVDKARLHSRAGWAGKGASFTVTSESRARFERVPVLEEAQIFSGSFVRIAEAAPGQPVWLSSRDLRRPAVTAPPPDVDADAGERWIDVDLATQTLVAYEGRRPVFATIVSTGKGRKGGATATPPGVYRIWIKLLTSDMDNLEDEGAARYYRMEDVPYVQYFSKGVGLHGAFWHRSFGHVRSHGCVNLAPLDAQRLFWWTSPRLPAGWTAVAPAAHEPGTVVRVR
jgi:lipoprotein-anchoring transpeptidase ErfK/SrfK